MEKEQMITESAIAVMHNEQMCDQFPGFPSIIQGLIETGKVMFSIHSPALEAYLKSFPFVMCEGLVPEGIDIVGFKFDREGFVNSDHFRQYAFTKVKDLNNQSQRLMDEAMEKQKSAGQKHNEACCLAELAGFIPTMAPPGSAQKAIERASQNNLTVHEMLKGE